MLDQPRHFLANRRAHRAADEQHVHRTSKDSVSANFSARGDDCFSQTRGALRLSDSLRIRLAVYKLQRINRDDFRVEFFAVPIVKQLFQSLVRAEAKVIAAVDTNLQ